MIAIIDYGMGNLKSVYNAFRSLNTDVRITSSPDVVRSANKIVLPGVGAFGNAMHELHERNLIDVLQETIKKKKPFLAVCLGLQILFEGSEEAPGTKGLAIFPGTVKRFNFKKTAENSLKIPHMGWNSMRIKRKECPVLKNVPDKSYFYFVHSYYYADTDKDICLAVTEYGIPFMSMVWKESVFATQFHPEKSQDVGIQILKNFKDI